MECCVLAVNGTLRRGLYTLFWTLSAVALGTSSGRGQAPVSDFTLYRHFRTLFPEKDTFCLKSCLFRGFSNTFDLRFRTFSGFLNTLTCICLRIFGCGTLKRTRFVSYPAFSWRFRTLFVSDSTLFGDSRTLSHVPFPADFRIWNAEKDTFCLMPCTFLPF